MSKAATCETTLGPGADIQAAINAAQPDFVICLSPGVYSPPATIVVSTSVTLQGPQAGVDPRRSAGTTRTPGDSTSEGTVDGGGTLANIFRVAADDVVLDGLEIRNGTGDLVESSLSAPVKYRTGVRFNIIHNSSGDEGIQLRNVTDAVIEYNHVYQTTGDGINLCCGATGGKIQHNEVHDINSPDAAIYVYDDTLATSNVNVTIEGNLVYNVTRNEGIKLGSKSGDDAGDTGGTIVGNVVHHTAQDGIAVYMSNTTVEGNDVSHSSSQNGAIYVAWAVGNIAIRSNCVHDNSLNTGTWGDPGGVMIGTDVNVGSVVVANNNIKDNQPNRVTNKATGTLSAESNWWGADDGPSGIGPGSGDAVSANVDFDPYLTTPASGTPCSDDQGPLTSDVAASPNPVAAGGTAALTALVDDTTTGNSTVTSAEQSADDGASWDPRNAVDGAFDSPVEAVEATFYAPASAGIYNLCVRGADVAGNTGAAECVLLVVYDPDAGFVTGGGEVNSPPEADLVNGADGPATFGFVSKYLRGRTTPDGNLEFQFKAGTLHFRSTSMEWLVVTGEPRARFRGEGVLNGVTVCKFEVDAWDGSFQPGGVDTFGIKINACGSGAPNRYALTATPLARGSIIIHR